MRRLPCPDHKFTQGRAGMAFPLAAGRDPVANVDNTVLGVPGNRAKSDDLIRAVTGPGSGAVATPPRARR